MPERGARVVANQCNRKAIEAPVRQLVMKVDIVDWRLNTKKGAQAHLRAESLSWN
jgi:hypothetical protein